MKADELLDFLGAGYSHSKVAGAGLSLWLGLENTLNDGTPSGFLASLPDPYNAGTRHSGFQLPLSALEADCVVCVGSIPSPLASPDHILFPFHPLLAHAGANSQTSARRERGREVLAIPTASLRTVYVPSLGVLLKLHLPSRIGRYSRDLAMFKWLSAIENSRELEMHQHSFANRFEILPESRGFFLPQSGYGPHGVIIRQIPRELHAADQNFALIPAFSLFASRGDAIALVSVIANRNALDETTFFNKFIAPLIEAFFACSLELGLIPEMNAQNVLYGFNGNGEIKIYLRDAGDFFKDLTQRKRHKLHTSFCSYKTIERGVSKDFFERRSFAFDFKLGEYIISPLIERVSMETNLDSSIIVSTIKDYVRARVDTENYFGSNNMWYRYENILGASRSDYVVQYEPKFR